MSDAPFPPRPVGTPTREVTLSGLLFPWRILAGGGEPVFVSMPGSEALYLACFENVDDLRDVLYRANVPFDSIKRIDDGGEFLESIPRRLDDREVKIIRDLRFTPEGRVRFTEINWDSPTFSQPPWEIAGTIVDVVKDEARHEVRIVVPVGSMKALRDEQIVELLEFTGTVRARLEAVVPPGWRVLD